MASAINKPTGTADHHRSCMTLSRAPAGTVLPASSELGAESPLIDVYGYLGMRFINGN